MRLFVISRHAESTLNHVQKVNGDPTVRVDLTEEGREEARLMGLQLRNLPIQACYHTRFGRTRQTAEIALADRDVSFHEEPLLDDIDVGELEGESIDAYRAWKREHTRVDPFPGGESLDAAALRYAQGLERILTSPHQQVLVVCHEIPLRYALNAAAGSDDLDGPVHQLGNAQPFFFTEDALRRAADGIPRLVGAAAG